VAYTDADRTYKKWHYAKCKAAGICVHCGKNAVASNRVLCDKCLEINRQRCLDRLRRCRVAGLCQGCGGKLDIPHLSRARCSKCRDKQLARSRARDKQAFAEYHKLWRETNPDQFRTIKARHRFRTRTNGGSLSINQLRARIDYYGGLCYVCGAEYEQVDHVIPVARGGTSWPANLRPICAHCNQSKGDKPLYEWLAIR